MKMKIVEKTKDIFTVNFDKYTIVHCISQDRKMGAGIAVPIRKKFKLDNMDIIKTYPTCIYYNNVLNLITKKKYWHKPTYKTLKESLIVMKDIIIKNKIRKIVMPRIGCGLDKLEYKLVYKLIIEVFEDIKIKILICSL